jgi:NAD(P)-dependent dehydrogenase (short-subunit alcohol dehydrogenase family)
MELGQWRITVNYLLPGAIQTGMTKDLLALEAVRKAWEEGSALKRLGEPLDIARAALMLVSDDADFITGHGLVVDGGLTLRSGPALQL